MVGILVIAHGTLGESLLQCAAHVLGRTPARLAQIGVLSRDDPADIHQRALAALATLDDGSGVLVLTDMFGATPSNIALRLLAPGRIEGIAGVSLPMLVRALNYRDQPLPTVLQKALSGGRDGVVRMTGPAADAAA